LPPERRHVILGRGGGCNATRTGGGTVNEQAGLPTRSIGDDTDDPTDFILNRELSEVHLLIDNISASPDTTIFALSAAQPPEGLPDDWVEQICQIRWPPAGTTRAQAEQAALLIRSKDYLNRLSKPASGATIAFTLLVTQEEDEGEGALGFLHRAAPRPPSRRSLAATAYPDLIPKAQQFRRVMKAMSWLLVGWLIFTCLLSWYVAWGNAALSDLTAARNGLAEAEVTVAQLQLSTTGGTASAPGSAARPTAPAQPGPAVAGPVGRFCPQAGQPHSYASVEQLQACEPLLRREAEISRFERSLDGWALWGDSDSARWLATILGTAVLPILYGFLGTGAAIVRSLSRKIKTSMLSPRDLHLSLQQLALGAVIGACIGLFIAQPDSPAGDVTLLGPVALSGSALSFVAGFGVEAVFQALEALISRIFNIAPAGGRARTDDAPGN
jgi:hypothetical protein